MKAVIQRTYGSPERLTLEEISEPSIRDNEVLVRVQAASIHPDVWHVLRGWPYVLRLMGAGLRHPNNPVPRTDVAGVDENIGENVTQFAPADAVFGETISGIQWVNGGAFAEYAAAPADSLTSKPSSVTFEEAAAVPTSGLIAQLGIHYQGQVNPGQNVLINGAGGGVGTFAVQLANAYGAKVTAVDRTEKVEMIPSIGANRVIDYTEEEYTRTSRRYDLILDIAGNHSFGENRRILTSDGRYVLIGHDHYGTLGRRFLGSLPRFLKLMALSPFVSELSALGFSTPSKSESLAALREFLVSGDLEPVVDRTFQLGKVSDAIQYLESGSVQGKIVIWVTPAT